MVDTALDARINSATHMPPFLVGIDASLFDTFILNNDGSICPQNQDAAMVSLVRALKDLNQTYNLRLHLVGADKESVHTATNQLNTHPAMQHSLRYPAISPDELRGTEVNYVDIAARFFYLHPGNEKHGLYKQNVTALSCPALSDIPALLDNIKQCMDDWQPPLALTLTP